MEQGYNMTLSLQTGFVVCMLSKRQFSSEIIYLNKVKSGEYKQGMDYVCLLKINRILCLN